nr:Gag-Pol polyprotein [Tanacetum cinerariifolium]
MKLHTLGVLDQARSQVIVGAREQIRNPKIVVPILEATVPPEVPLAHHQIPIEISIAQNQNIQTSIKSGLQFFKSQYARSSISSGIKREYSNARTPQQNGVAKRKNRTLIEAARTMLSDSLLPVTFWAEAVNTDCYVLNRALVTKTHNKTPYELLNGRSPRLDFIRPFGYHVTILNTLDPLGKFKGTQDNVDAGKEVSDQHYIVFPLWSSISSTYKSLDDKPADDNPKDDTADALRKEFEQGCIDKKGVTQAGSTNSFNTVSNPDNAASKSGTFSAGGPSAPHPDAFIPANTLLHVDQDDFENLIWRKLLNYKVHIDHPKDQILRDPKSAVQIRGMAKKSSRAHALVSYIHKQRRTNHKDYENCLFACFLSQKEPKKVSQALDDESWVEVMQEELLQFILQKVWRLVDLPYGKKAIGTKWVKQSEEGIIISHDKYVVEILKKFDFSSVKAASTPIETQKPLVKDEYKRQTIVATSTTESEYVDAAHCCGHVLWIQNQMLDYGFNFMNTKIYIDNESTIYPGTKKLHWGGADAQTRIETAFKRSSDPPLSTGHTVRSGEDRMEQETNLTDFVPTTPHDSPLLGGHTPRSDEGRPNLL